MMTHDHPHPPHQKWLLKSGSKSQGLPSGPLLPHGLVLVKNLSTFNLVQEHVDIAPKTWSWSNFTLKYRSMRSSRDNLAQLGKEIMEGIKSVVSCPTRRSLYWPLALCVDHPFNREAEYSNVLSSQWHSLSVDVSAIIVDQSQIPSAPNLKEALRQKTKALATGFGSFVEKNLPPFSRWSLYLDWEKA